MSFETKKHPLPINEAGVCHYILSLFLSKCCSIISVICIPENPLFITGIIYALNLLSILFGTVRLIRTQCKPACGKSLNIGAHIGRMPFHLRQSILHESVNTVRIGGSIYGLDTRMYAPVYRLLAYTHDKKHIGLNDTFGYNNFICSELKGGNIFIISAGYAELLKL